MKYIEYTFPEIEEIVPMDTAEQNILIDELDTMNAYHKQMVRTLLEQKVVESFTSCQPTALKVIIHPNYTRNDSDFNFENAMVWLDNWVDPHLDNNANSRFQQTVDASLSKLVSLMREVVELDINELLDKYDVKPVDEPPEENKKKHNYKF